jgi:hypothetical protein
VADNLDAEGAELVRLADRLNAADADNQDDDANPAGMDDTELAALLAAHETRAVGYFTSEIADEQAKAINYYYGRVEDVPVLDGCSSVVDHTVAVQVDNAVAAVLKPFVSAQDMVAFEPRGADDVAQAEQATDYVNYVINCDNPGFIIFHNWFKDALLTKIGVVKAWWEDTTQTVTQQAVLDAMQLEAARQSDKYLAETDNGDGTFTVDLQEIQADGRIHVEAIPPEEFLITPFARSIEETPYCAHRPSNYTRSMLLELGFDAEVVEGLPAFGHGQNEESRSQARYQDEEWHTSTRDAIGSDSSLDIIGLIDEYARVDYDGDGVAELRRVIRVGETILFNEPVDEIPFALLCPCPMPHKVYGRSLADQAMEGQKASTAIIRQALDNLYKHNNPRPIVGAGALLEDNATMEDIGDSSPGAVIRAKDATQLGWATVPYVAEKSFGMLEYIAQGVEEQTGIQRKGNGFNAEALKKNSPETATQAAIDENSRNERAEMIARIFAETGVKRLFKLVLKLLVQHQPKARVIKLRGQWVPVDPGGWSPEMDVSVSVGLGIGNKAEQIGQAQTVLQGLERLAATPYGWLVRPENAHAAMVRLFNAAGIKDVDRYLGDPSQPPQDEGEPSPEAQESAAKIAIMRAESEAKIQLEREKAIAEQQLARDKMQAEIMLAREKIAAGAAADVALSRNRAGGSLNA